MTKRCFLILHILLVFFVADSYAAKIESVRLWRSPESTRLVFDLDAQATHKLFQLSNPKRLVIDIESTTFDAPLQSLKLADTPVLRVRHGPQKNGGLRVVLDLKEDVNPRSFFLKKITGKPDRLVVDLYDKKKKTYKSIDSLIGEKTKNSARNILIAIDAGHGGEDPGAIGPGRLYEKNIVLKIAKNLANTINATPGYKALLIRDGDYFIRLGDRAEKARQAQADLFLSIHADGFKNPKAHGGSVFTLSPRGASSKMASILASKENKSDLIGGVDRIQLGDKEDQLRKILVDLSMTRSMETSADIGRRVLGEMGKVTKLHSKRVESAGFAVLKSPDVPSLLIETGFITNPGEARKLNTLNHRTALSKAIFNGIQSYFSRYPPEGTLLAQKRRQGNTTATVANSSPKTNVAEVDKAPLKYKIARGDTLSSIARRYKVSVSSLKRTNKLKSSTIRVGQILTIPAG